MTDKRAFSAGYEPLLRYVAPIRPELWRLFLGLLLMTAIFMSGVIATFVVTAFFAFSQQFDGQGGTAEMMGGTPLEIVIFLGSFIFLIAGAAVATKGPGDRAVGSLVGPLPAALRDCGRVLAAMVPLLALCFVLTLYLGTNVVQHMSLAALLPWLPLGLLVLLIQCSAEELAFRGFIMGQLAARFRSPLVWLGLPAIVFGALHWDATSYGAQAWIICLATALFALIAGDLTARTGNLGAAIALHFANNFFAMVLIGETGRMDGLSLYTMPLDLTNIAMLAAQFVFTIVLWLAARLALRV